MNRHAVSKTQQEQVLEAVRRAGVLRPRDLEVLGLPREQLSRLRGAAWCIGPAGASTLPPTPT